MSITDLLMLVLLILFYAAYNIFATVIVGQNTKLTRQLKIIIGIFTWIIPVMAGIIIIQRYYPSAKKKPEKVRKGSKKQKKK